MYKLCHRIEIGEWLVRRPEKVRVLRSVDTLSDTAEVVLPGMLHGKAIEIEKQISVGDQVKIDLGYDGELKREFEGYVSRIGTDGGSIKIECEDQLWQTRKPVSDREYRDVTVKELIEAVIGEAVGGELKVNCLYDFRYDKFTVVNATCRDVLKKVQDEVKPNIFINDRGLWVVPKYMYGSAKEVEYDFSRNIEKSGTSLEYRRKEDRPVLVTVEGERRDGTKVRVEEGVTGGDRVTLRLPGVTDEESMRTTAQQVLAEKSYTGYSGSFSSWLRPYAEPTNIAKLHDPDYEYKDGEYWITAVETEYSRSGGKRKITLGKRLN